MLSSKKILVFAVAVLFCLTTSNTFAQQSSSKNQNADIRGYDNPSRTGPQLSPEKQEQIRKKVDTLRIWRLTETLRLDSESSAKLASILSSHDRQRGNLFRERRETMRALRTAVTSKKPDETKLQTLLDQLETNHRSTQELTEMEWKSLQGILNTEQQARFVIFQQDFRRDIQKMISRARETEQGKGPVSGRAQNQ